MPVFHKRRAFFITSNLKRRELSFLLRLIPLFLLFVTVRISFFNIVVSLTCTASYISAFSVVFYFMLNMLFHVYHLSQNLEKVAMKRYSTRE